MDIPEDNRQNSAHFYQSMKLCALMDIDIPTQKSLHKECPISKEKLCHFKDWRQWAMSAGAAIFFNVTNQSFHLNKRIFLIF